MRFFGHEMYFGNKKNQIQYRRVSILAAGLGYTELIAWISSENRLSRYFPVECSACSQKIRWRWLTFANKTEYLSWLKLNLYAHCSAPKRVVNETHLEMCYGMCVQPTAFWLPSHRCHRAINILITTFICIYGHGWNACATVAMPAPLPLHAYHNHPNYECVIFIAFFGVVLFVIHLSLQPGPLSQTNSHECSAMI